MNKVKPKKVLSLRLPVEEIQRRERVRQAWAAGESQAVGVVDAKW